MEKGGGESLLGVPAVEGFQAYTLLSYGKGTVPLLMRVDQENIQVSWETGEETFEAYDPKGRVSSKEGVSSYPREARGGEGGPQRPKKNCGEKGHLEKQKPNNFSKLMPFEKK